MKGRSPAPSSLQALEGRERPSKGMFGINAPEIMACSGGLEIESFRLAERSAHVRFDVVQKTAGPTDNDAEGQNHRGNERKDERILN